MTRVTALLSIVVPAYNAERSLSRSLESIIASSTYVAGEAKIVVVDDGSTDDTSRLADSFAAQHEDITVFHKSNGGVSSALNVGLASITTPFVTFAASDDYVASEYHRVMVEALERDDTAAFAMGGYTTIQASTEAILQEGTEQTIGAYGETLTTAEVPLALVSLLQRNLLFSVCNKVYRTDTIRKHRVEFEIGRKSAEDLFFNLDYLAAAPGGIINVDSAGYFYVRHPSSTTVDLESNYSDIHELDTSIAYRRILTDRLLALDVPQADINRYFFNKDNTWFYIMVRNVTNPGTPYGPAEQLAQIREIMNFKPARENILANRTRSRLAILNRMLYRVGSPRLVRATLSRL